MSERDSDWPPGTHYARNRGPPVCGRPRPGDRPRRPSRGCAEIGDTSLNAMSYDVGRSGGGSRAPAAARRRLRGFVGRARAGGGASPLQGRECRVVPRRPRPADRSAAARTGASNPNPSPGSIPRCLFTGAGTRLCSTCNDVSAVPVWPHRRPLRICRARPRAFISPTGATAFEHAFEQAPRAGAGSRRGEALWERVEAKEALGSRVPLLGCRVCWGRPLLSRPRGAVGSGLAAVLESAKGGGRG